MRYDLLGEIINAIVYNPVAAAFGYGYVIVQGFRLIQSLRKSKDEKITPCPHGHENWDDCPDCCH